ncbi:uncharacterized protein LOC144826114 isoform X2 [Lissotriton helveticus]
MYRLESNKVCVSFHDVAAGFSVEEWELLHKWQKSLYEAVMREIYHVLDSLGPAIATSVFSLRATENEARYPVGDAGSERRCSEMDSPGHKNAGEVTSPTSIKDEAEAHHTSCLDTQGSGCSTELASFRSGDYSRKEEQQSTIVLDYTGAESHKRNTAASSVTSFLVKQEDDANSMDPQLSKKANDHVRHPRDGSVNTEMKVRRSVVSAEKTGEFKALCAQEGTVGAQSKSYIWPEINLDFEVEKNTQHESGSSHQVYKGHLQDVASNFHCAQKSDVNTENILGYQSKTQKYWRSQNHYEVERTFPMKRPPGHRCSHTATFSGADCEKCFTRKGALFEHKTTLVVERPYQCTECEKTFKHKENFIEHQRTHTGQRPYQCTDCGKSFIRKRTLIAHQRIHTGERPYQCTGCGKSFSLKHNLNTHQKTCRHFL